MITGISLLKKALAFAKNQKRIVKEAARHSVNSVVMLQEISSIWSICWRLELQIST
jgi:hypothetical protein